MGSWRHDMVENLFFFSVEIFNDKTLHLFSTVCFWNFYELVWWSSWLAMQDTCKFFVDPFRKWWPRERSQLRRHRAGGWTGSRWALGSQVMLTRMTATCSSYATFCEHPGPFSTCFVCRWDPVQAFEKVSKNQVIILITWQNPEFTKGKWQRGCIYHF